MWLAITKTLLNRLSITGPAANGHPPVFHSGDKNIRCILQTQADYHGQLQSWSSSDGNHLVGNRNTTAPYSYALDKTSLGSPSLTAKQRIIRNSDWFLLNTPINDWLQLPTSFTVSIPRVLPANAQFTQVVTTSTITANASVTDGEPITKSEFFNGNNLVWEQDNDPYSYAWTNAPLGKLYTHCQGTDG